MNNGRKQPDSRPAVIFDLDGTVADTLDDITNAVNYALENAMREPLDRAAVRPMIGHGLPTLMSRAGQTDEGPMIDFLVRRFREHYDEHHLVHTQLYAGLNRVFDACDQAGMPMAILSNKPHVFTLLICDQLLDPWTFAIMGTHEGLPIKPHPAGALALADALKREPGEVFLVGDSAVDIATAKAAGMRSVGVTWGFRERAELIGAGPDYLVDDVEQLLRVLVG